MIKPKLIIPHESYKRLKGFVDVCPVEVTGFADVEYDPEEKVFVVGKIYLVKQTAQPAEVDMNEEDVAKFTDELISQGSTQLPRIWWHSHANMPAFFSATDDATQKELVNDSYMISLVLNKEGKMQANLNLWKPFPYRFEDMEISLGAAVDAPTDEIKKEYEEKVVVSLDEGTIRQIPPVTGKTIWDLPKDRNLAQEKINDYHICKIISQAGGQYLLISEIGNVWRDIWEDPNDPLIYWNEAFNLND